MTTSLCNSASNNNSSHSPAPSQHVDQAWENFTGYGSLTLETAMNLLMGQFSQTRTLIEELRVDVNSKIDSMKSAFERTLNILQGEVHSLKKEYAAKFCSQDAAVASLDQRMNKLMQNVEAVENRKELMINGIPYASDENLEGHFAAICRALELNESRSMLVNPRRIKTVGTKVGDVRPICVEFALKSSRDQFYSAYLQKRDLTLQHLGLGSNRRVYINESLNIDARQVKVEALRLKKANKLSAVFTKGGIVHVKCSIGSPAIVVSSVQELDNLQNDITDCFGV